MVTHDGTAVGDAFGAHRVHVRAQHLARWLSDLLSIGGPGLGGVLDGLGEFYLLRRGELQDLAAVFPVSIERANRLHKLFPVVRRAELFCRDTHRRLNFLG
jgi:hypothetical protein